MTMLGAQTHQIDPVITSVMGIPLWWYGLGFSLGFASAHCSIRRGAREMGLSRRGVWSLSLLLAGGVLVGGRLVEVVFYEWEFYREHALLIPAVWIGGMATHGLLFGGLAGIGLFCWRNGKSFLGVADGLAAAAALILAVGRVGNFIDGQIVGSVTGAAWGVKFPDAEGFRHPVVLYDGLKNLLIIPVLWRVRRVQPGRGMLIGLFLFLYAGLRVPIDVFREYPTSLWGLATGQSLNLCMAASGLLLVVSRIGGGKRESGVRAKWVARGEGETGGVGGQEGGVAWRKALFAAIVVLCPVIPSDWTQDVPARYSKRHPGLARSWIYPAIEGRGARGSMSSVSSTGPGGSMESGAAPTGTTTRWDQSSTRPTSGPAASRAAGLSEGEKIEAMIESLGELEGAKFIRNGKEHSVGEAISHMRSKWKWKRSSIRTAEDFIRLVGSRSSQSGEAYVIRKADGSSVSAEAWFRRKLVAIEGPTSRGDEGVRD